MNSGEKVAANWQSAQELLDHAAAGGADMAALPELFTYLGASSRHPEVAEPIPGYTGRKLAGIARKHKMWVLGGSFLESADSRIYNTSLLFDRKGKQIACYRKIHLFDVNLPGQPPMRESATLASGSRVVSAQTENGLVGLTICYDIRFPELYRRLSGRGVKLFFLPSAFTFETGEYHWEPLLRARAIENQAFMVAPVQCGTWSDEKTTRRCYGDSMVVDAWGEIIARRRDGVGVTFAELDFEQLEEVRKKLPALRHRRLNLQN